VGKETNCKTDKTKADKKTQPVLRGFGYLALLVLVIGGLIVAGRLATRMNATSPSPPPSSAGKPVPPQEKVRRQQEEAQRQQAANQQRQLEPSTSRLQNINYVNTHYAFVKQQERLYTALEIGITYMDYVKEVRVLAEIFTEIGTPPDALLKETKDLSYWENFIINCHKEAIDDWRSAIDAPAFGVQYKQLRDERWRLIHENRNALLRTYNELKQKAEALP